MKLKEIREIKGLSRQDLADIMKMSKRTIEAWESGARKAPDYVIESIEDKILNLSKEELEYEKKYCVIEFDSIEGESIVFIGSKKECNKREDELRTEISQEERLTRDYTVKKLSDYEKELEYMEALKVYESTLTAEERAKETIIDGKKYASYILNFRKMYYNK